MIAVVLDPSMRNPRDWKGNVGLTLKKNLYINMSEDIDDPYYMSNQLKMLVNDLQSKEIYSNPSGMSRILIFVGFVALNVNQF